MEAQRGFTLAETLVAAAIAFVIGWQLLGLAHVLVLGASHLDARLRAHSAADRLEERLTGDAGVAWSVFVPRRDVFGSPNADGHELDFVTEDAAHRTFWRAYGYDAAARRVTSYAYAPGGVPEAGETYDGIAAFAARAHPITDLFRPGNEVYDPLFAGSAVGPIVVPFGWSSAAAGGNGLVRVRLRGGGVARDALLAAGTAPTRFTVVVEYTPAPSPTP
jgi:hypothetical protein